jgi:hypothetical protein
MKLTIVGLALFTSFSSLLLYRVSSISAVLVGKLASIQHELELQRNADKQLHGIDSLRHLLQEQFMDSLSDKRIAELLASPSSLTTIADKLSSLFDTVNKQSAQISILNDKISNLKLTCNNNNNDDDTIRKRNEVASANAKKENVVSNSLTTLPNANDKPQIQRQQQQQQSLQLVTDRMSQLQLYIYNKENVAQWISNMPGERRVRAVFNIVLRNNACLQENNQDKLVLDIGANAGYYG